VRRGMGRFSSREEEGKGFPQDRRGRMGYAPNYSPIFLLANYFQKGIQKVIEG